MTDVHNKKTRSYNMSQIKGKNTKPELLVRRFLHANGFRFQLPGRLMLATVASHAAWNSYSASGN